MDPSDAAAAWTDEKWAETERETEEWGKHMARMRAQSRKRNPGDDNHTEQQNVQPSPVFRVPPPPGAADVDERWRRLRAPWRT